MAAGGGAEFGCVTAAAASGASDFDLYRDMLAGCELYAQLGYGSVAMLTEFTDRPRQRIFAGMEKRSRPEGIVPWCEWQLTGAAETVLRKLQANLDVGFNHIILHFATPGIPVGVRHRWATRFANDVAPHGKRLLPTAPAVSGRAG